MNIVIAGWYYWPEILKQLSSQTTYPVNIIAHRSGESFGINTTVIKNIGLEFHCYDYFLTNIWDKTNDVLFMHDDIILKDISILKDIDNIKQPLTMIWHNQKHYLKNLGHGRCFKCSASFLSAKPYFWYDKNNNGDVINNPFCNQAMSKLYQETKNILNHFYTDKLYMAKRGEKPNDNRYTQPN